MSTKTTFDPLAFGRNLKKLRTERGLTQTELAAVLDISRPSIAHYERGTREPSFTVLNLLCDFFDISADALLGREPRDLYRNQNTNSLLNVADSDR